MYLSKSIKGKSIISNLDVEGECYFNTNIQNACSGNYNIGSPTNHFKTLYIDSLNINSQMYVPINSSFPLNYNSTTGNISLNLNNNQLFISQGSLNVKDNFSSTQPLTYSNGNLQLNYSQPLFITNGNLGLNINLQQFTITNNALNIIDNLTTTSPINYVGKNLNLQYNLNQFYVSNGNLNITNKFANLSSTAPLSYNQTSGNITLNYSSPLTVSSAGNLNLSIDNSLQITNGSLSVVDNLSGITPLSYNKFTKTMRIDNLGTNCLALFDNLGLKSLSNLYYDPVADALQVNGVIISETINEFTQNNHAATKAYVDNKNTYLSNTPIYYTDDGPNRIWRIRYDNTSIGVDANGNLKSLLHPNVNSAITIDPNSNIDLLYNTYQFSVIGGKLTSSLLCDTNSPITLSTSNQLSFNYDSSAFTILNGTLKSKVIGVGAVSVNPYYEISVDVNPTYLSIFGNQITFSSSFVEQITNINTTLQKSQTDITSINSQVGSINTQITTINGQITAHDGQLTAINTQITVHEGQLGTLTATTTALTTGLATTVSQLNTITPVVAGLSASTVILNAYVFGVLGIGSVQSKINGLDDKTALLKTRVDGVDGQINTLNSSSSTNDSRLVKIEANITNGNLLIGSSGNLNVQGLSNTIGNIFMTSTGNIGINTTNPQFSLDINGTTRISNTLSANNSLNTLGNLYTNNGNIGINTTNPQYTLDINGTLRTGSGTSVFGNASNNSIIDLQGLNSRTVIYALNDGNSYIQYSNNFSISKYGGGNTPIYIQGSTGNVGINKSNPQFAIDVNGTGNFINVLSTNTSSGNLNSNNIISTYVNSNFISSANIVSTNISASNIFTYILTVLNSNISNITAGNIVSTSINTSFITITGGSLNATYNTNTIGSLFTIGGNVGINTTSPNYTLDVNGSGRVSGTLITNNISVSNTGTLANVVSTNTTTNNLIASNSSISNLIASNLLSPNSSITNLGVNVINGNVINGTLSSIANGIFINATVSNMIGTNVTLSNIISVNSSMSSLNTMNVTVSNMIVNNIFNGSFNANTLGNIFTTGGNVGINTTSPNFKLDVNGNTRISNNLSLTNGFAGSTALNSNLLYIKANGDGYHYIATGSSNPISNYSGDGTIIAGNAGGALAYQGGSSSASQVAKLVWNSNGVGINNINPQFDLDVNGTGNFSNINSTNANINNLSAGNINVNSITTNSSNINYATLTNISCNNLTTNNAVIVNGLNSNFNSNTLGNIFTTGGNVGINNKTPQTTLDIIGGLKTSSLSSSALAANTFISNPNTSLLNLLTPNSISGNYSSMYFGQSMASGNTGQLNFQYIGNNSTANNMSFSFYGGAVGIPLTIMNSGNVGINNGAPTYKLDINGSTRITNTLNANYSVNTLGNLYTNNGNIGINTTSPMYTLDINGTLRTGSGTSVFGNATNNSIIDLQGGLGSRTVLYALNDGNSFLQFGNNLTINKYGSANTPIYISGASGNVGLNNINPLSTLDINGNLSIRNGGNNVIAINANNGNFASIDSLASNNTTRLPLILNGYGGNVGVGTTNPVYPLSVYGKTINSQSYQYYGIGASAYTQTGSGAYGNGWSIFCEKSILALEFDACSDRRIKTNILDTDKSNSERLLKQIKVKTYDYINKIKYKDINVHGVIGQQIQEFFPEAVTISNSIVDNLHTKVLYKDLMFLKNTIGIPNNFKENLKVKDKLDVSIINHQDKSIDKETYLVTKITNKYIYVTNTNKIKIGNDLFVHGTYVDDFHGVDYSKFTPILIDTVQQLYIKLEALTKRVNELEGM